MKGGASKILVAIVVGLAAMLLVFVLARNSDPAGGGPDATTITYMIGTLILVSAGNWALLRRLSLSMYVRSVGIWIVVGAVAFGLYYLLYPGGR